MIESGIQRYLRVIGWGPATPVPITPLWAAWSDLVDSFPLWWYLSSGLRPGRQRWAAIDDVGRMRVKPRVVRVLDRLATNDVALVEQLAGLARANLDRHIYFSRMVLLAYFTIPLTVGAMLAQLAPGWLNQVMADHVPPIIGGFGGAAVAVVVRLIAEARARQLVTILDFALIERGLSPQKL